MPPAPLTMTLRYTPPGTRKYYWVTTIATYTSPTRAEINAGIDLTAEIPDGGVSGFTLTSNSTMTPDLSNRFNSQVPARIDAADSEIIFYASSTSADVRTVLPRDTVGYVMFLPEGDVAGQKCEVWPAKVKSMFLDPSTEDAGKVHVQMAITKIPAQNVTVPA